MKVKDIPKLQQYIALLLELDPRLTAVDFNNIYRTFRNTLKEQT